MHFCRLVFSFFSFLFTESSDSAMLTDTEEGTKDFAHLCLVDIYMTVC